MGFVKSEHYRLEQSLILVHFLLFPINLEQVSEVPLNKLQGVSLLVHPTKFVMHPLKNELH